MFAFSCNLINKKIYLMLVMLKNTINQFWNKNNKKVVKQTKAITEQPKPVENSNTIDIKATIKHEKLIQNGQ